LVTRDSPKGSVCSSAPRGITPLPSRCVIKYAANTIEIVDRAHSSGPREPDVGNGLVNLLRRRVSILVRPSRAGRPESLRQFGSDQRLSILVRPSRAGRPAGCPGCSGLQLLSILVRPSRAGRPRWGVLPRSDPAAFNPRPALASRTSRRLVRKSPGASAFNPRPALASRTSPKSSPIRDTFCAFNPRPALASRTSPETQCMCM